MMECHIFLKFLFWYISNIFISLTYNQYEINPGNKLLYNKIKFQAENTEVRILISQNK